MTGLLPNLIVGGAPRSGTSSLHRWLADHPDALGSSEKETYYFVDPGTHMYRPERNVSSGLAGYARYFEHAAKTTPKAVFESTPSYLYSEVALAHLPDLDTSPKFVFVLREPSEQIYSLFNYFKINWNWIPKDLSFSDYINEITHGSPSYGGNELAVNALVFANYYNYISRWRDRLAGPQRMRVWLFEHLREDSRTFIKQVAEYAGLDPDFYDSYDFTPENETYDVRSHTIQDMNVAIRGLLPRGPAYKFLRSVYRFMNTRKPSSATNSDYGVLRQLKLRYREANERLGREFDLDLSAWR